MKQKIEEIKKIAENRKARHLYHIIKTYETGIVLLGTEVKSCRDHKVNFKDSYARISNGEVYLYNLHISPYKNAGVFSHDPARVRKLLLHKQEINRLATNLNERGHTLIPLRIYFKNNLVKLELGLAKGKKLYDKRKSIQKKDEKRQHDRLMKQYGYQV